MGPGVWQLTFTCPKCGPGNEISVYMHAHPADEARRLWRFEPVTAFDSAGWIDTLTVTPSIGEPPHGRKRCTWHGSIAKGEVIG